VLMGCDICGASGGKETMADGMEIDCSPDWGDGGVIVLGRLLYRRRLGESTNEGYFETCWRCSRDKRFDRQRWQIIVDHNWPGSNYFSIQLAIRDRNECYDMIPQSWFFFFGGNPEQFVPRVCRVFETSVPITNLSLGIVT
jgi:hypothetical protein